MQAIGKLTYEQAADYVNSQVRAKTIREWCTVDGDRAKQEAANELYENTGWTFDEFFKEEFDRFVESFRERGRK